MNADITSRGAQYLSFTVAGADYGVPILAVREILRHAPPTRVPGLPPAVRGVVDVRGVPVPVADLAVGMGVGAVAETARTCILVVETESGGRTLPFGVLADSVNGVVELSAEAIEPVPEVGAGAATAHLTGVGRVDGAFVLLLDLGTALLHGLAGPAAGAAGG